MWSSTESVGTHIPGNIYAFIMSTSSKSKGINASLERHILHISAHKLGALVLCPEPGHGAEDFRVLPEYEVVVTPSPSAMTLLRVTPLVLLGYWYLAC